MATDSAIMRAAARPGREVEGISADSVFGIGPAEPDEFGVRGLPDDIAPYVMTGPALVVMDGDTTIIPGSWERTTLLLDGTVWIGYAPRAANMTTLVDLRSGIQDAYRAHAAAGLVDETVQSLILLGFGRVDERRWLPASDDDPSIPWYLVLPFRLEVKVTKAVTYSPS